MENFTVDGNFTRDMSKPFMLPLQIGVVLSAFNMFLSITASLGNALILVALHKETSLHPPTKRLFRCLAVTDLCVGVISQPLFAVSLLLSVTTGINLKFIFFIDTLYIASSFVLCPVSVFTSSAISVDRLLAVLSGLRYRHVVTLSRVRTVIICFWLIGISCGSIFVWYANIAYTVAFALTTFSLTVSVLSYAKIFRKLRQHQLQVHAVPQGQNNGREVPLNIARYRKSVSCAIWVQLAQVTCYTPFLVLVMLMSYGRMSAGKLEIALEITASLTYLNSSLNPILYYWRIGAVRQAAKDTIKQLNCCKSA